MRKLCLALVFFSLSAAAQSHNWAIQAEGGMLSTHGFSQIPKGGQPGSSSLRRPDFNEVNVHHPSFYQLGATYQIGCIHTELKYFHIAPHGETTLQAPLTTHHRELPQGRSFYFNANYNGATLCIGLTKQHGPWTHQRAIGVLWLDYDYRFTALPDYSRRHFSAITPLIDVKTTRRFARDWQWQVTGQTTFSATNLDQYRLGAGIGKRFCHHGIQVIPTLSINWWRIDFEDNQTLPNHFLLSSKPFVQLGFEVSRHSSNAGITSGACIEKC